MVGRPEFVGDPLGNLGRSRRNVRVAHDRDASRVRAYDVESRKRFPPGARGLAYERLIGAVSGEWGR